MSSIDTNGGLAKKRVEYQGKYTRWIMVKLLGRGTWFFHDKVLYGYFKYEVRFSCYTQLWIHYMYYKCYKYMISLCFSFRNEALGNFACTFGQIRKAFFDYNQNHSWPNSGFLPYPVHHSHCLIMLHFVLAMLYWYNQWQNQFSHFF